MRIGTYGAKLIITKAWVVLVAALILATYFAMHALASPVASWISGTPVLAGEVEYRKGQYGANEARKCVSISMPIAGSITPPQQRCVTTGDNTLIDDRLEYIKVGNDQKYYRMQGIYSSYSSVRRTHVPSTNTLVTRSGYTMFTYSAALSIEKNLLSSLSPIDNPSDPRQYQYEHRPDFTLADSNGPLPVAHGLAYSNNGRWLIVELMGIGLARIDLQNDYKAELVSTLAPGYYVGSNPSMVLAISDDGKGVAVGGGNTPFMIYEVDESCTKHIRQDEPLNRTGYDGCPGVGLSEVTGLTGQYQRPYGLEFGENSYELRYHAGGGSTELCGANSEFEGCEEWKMIRAAGYTPPVSQLDYLALGDSYSSGEGDIERKVDGSTYYLQGTDVDGDYENGIPDERCHISSRSYPLALQQSGAVGGDRVRSVACSGAKRVDIQGWNFVIGDDEAYLGQFAERKGMSMPRLRGLDNLVSLQNDALEEYIPGRLQQIDFVKLSRPKITSLMIGGNDLGFGEVLLACISKTAIFGTCEYATDSGRKETGSLIKNFRMQLVDVYKSILEVSPKSKLYVMGYPQFISSTQNFCGANSTLNRSDREFVTQSVTYLNQVIKSAAHQAGAYYVDIEDALGENILCASVLDRYVNGVTAVLRDQSEAFHPNHKGHMAIANRIKDGLLGQALESFSNCANNPIITCPGYGSSQSPDIPEYLNPPSIEDRIVQAADIVRDAGNNIASGLQKGTSYIVRLNPFIAQPTTTVNVSLHSNPINLGDFTVGADGSLEATIMVPSTIPAGYHTLYLTGKTYSGENITLRQIVQVHGTDPTDLDENNVPDTQQPCGIFIIASGADVDLDGVDDACDPEIGETRGLYRWRQGDSRRSYNGTPEDVNQVYIERNVWAGSLTGITGDHDPDGDGWAIVGISKSDQLIGVNMSGIGATMDLEILGDGSQANPYSPVLYVFPNTQDCRAYHPTILSKVAAQEPRTLSIAPISNDKCPQKLPDNNPQEPTPEPPKNEGLLSKIKSTLQAVKTQLNTVISAITKTVTKLLNLLIPSYR